MFVPLDRLSEGDFVYDCEETLHVCRGPLLPGATACGRVPPRGILAADLAPDEARCLEEGGTAELHARFEVRQDRLLRREWIDRGSYLVSRHPQGSEAWLSARKGLLTASKVGAAVGHCRFTTPDQLRAGCDPADDAARERMAHGSKWEGPVRAWYARKYSVQVDEVGLAVPKWDQRIGASLDGQVRGLRRCLEIKCPQRMYWRVAQYTDLSPEEKVRLGRFYHAHIFDSHYDQMQTCMAVTGNDVCDYVVYEHASGTVCVVPVPFNRAYWEGELYPAVRAFLG